MKPASLLEVERLYHVETLEMGRKLFRLPRISLLR